MNTPPIPGPAYQVLEKAAAFIRVRNLLPPGASVLVACSGGADSVALAWVLQQLGYTLAFAHVNYGLRGQEALADEQFVQGLAASWRIPFYVHRTDPESLKAAGASLQAEARRIRYAFFEATLASLGWKYCATGHHADDQAETALLSLLRGAGPDIMRGIPASRPPYVRPLLPVKKTEIRTCLESLGQPFRTDSSNQSETYLRNRIRHEALPALRRIHPEAEDRLLQQLEQYSQEQQLLETVLLPYRQEAGEGSLDWTGFVDTYGARHLEVLAGYVLQDWGITGPAREAALTLLNSQPGHGLDMPGGRLERTRKGLNFSKVPFPQPMPSTLHSISAAAWLDLRTTGVEVSVCEPSEVDYTLPDTHFLDPEALVLPLVFRPWQQGDTMQPLGMSGHKLLSDIFVDEAYSRKEKAAAVVVEDQQGIVCLSGFRIGERVKLSPAVSRVLRIRFVTAP